MSLLRNELVLRAARRLPEPVRRRGRRIALGQDTPRWGNLRRTAPFSERWGWDRGTPVDRVYIEAFVAAHAADVRGDVLEVRDSRYAERFGGDRVSAVHVLDIDPDNPRATIVADLAGPGALPPGRFDCIVLTQVLQYVNDPDAALANAWSALAPGGVLLVTVPTISRLDYPDGVPDLWRWTPAGLERLLRRVALDAPLEVEGHGNLLAATAFLQGLSAEELSSDELELFDPLFLVCATARATKPPA